MTPAVSGRIMGRVAKASPAKSKKTLRSGASGEESSAVDTEKWILGPFS
jgi:hypothetical protein